MSLMSAEEMLQVAYARPFPAPNKEVYIRTVVSCLHHLLLIILNSLFCYIAFTVYWCPLAYIKE